MEFYLKKLHLSVCIALVIAIPSLAYSIDDLKKLNSIEQLSYGEIYLAQPERIVKGKNDFSVSYGAGLGVPQYTLHSLKISGEHWFSQSWWLGGNFELNFTDKSSLQKNVESLLIKLGNAITYEYPTMALRASAGIAPLSGLVNVFGERVLPYELSLSADIGMVEYKSKTNVGPFVVKKEKVWHGTSIGLGLDQRILLYKNNGIKLGFNQYFENKTNSSTKGLNQRSIVTIGWYGRF